MGLYGQLGLQPKRKVFISYHHGNDQQYYNEISRTFSSVYDVIQDNSLERAIDSDNPEYVRQRIREKCITGSSCSLVLCGLETPWRKYVDWEIKATLDKQHGLIGVNLPSNPQTSDGHFIVPDRLHDNILSGYAVWIQWNDLILSIDSLRQTIEIAKGRNATLIRNERQMRQRNGSRPWQ